MLIEHGIDHMREALIAREQPVPSRQEISFEPALAHMLAEDLRGPAARAYEFVRRQQWLHRYSRRAFENAFQPIGLDFIGRKDSKIGPPGIRFYHIAKIGSH